MPISEWEKEYATLSGQRTAEYTKLKETRAEVAELHNIRKCVDIALKPTSRSRPAPSGTT